MTVAQILVLAVIAAVFVLFLIGRWRYDLVAFAGLLLAVVLGVVPAEKAFSGFGHPATVTVAAVLVLSRALSNVGVPDRIAGLIQPATKGVVAHVALLSGIGAALSSFMNNVGALALLMPAAVRSALAAKRSPAILLMPLAFGSMLGGLITAIGTPPNIIIATYRQHVTGQAFAMFDFTPVGAAVALVGLGFMATYGWRLIPKERRSRAAAEDLFQIDSYISEVRVPKGNPIIGETLAEVESLTGDSEATVVGLVRRKKRLPGLPMGEPIRAGDILIVSVSPDRLDRFATKLGLKIVGAEKEKGGLLRSEQIGLMEAVVAPGSTLEGREAQAVRFRRRFGVNLLGVSRQGKPTRGRLGSFRFRVGDVILLHGEIEALAPAVAQLGCLPIQERSLPFGVRRKTGLAIALFAAAIAAAAAGALALPVALGLAALAMVLLNIVPPREVYDSIDWPVIVLLGAMIPIGASLESSGLAKLVVETVFGPGGAIAPWLALSLILVVTMTLSDVLNNAATAVIMAPIGLFAAERLGANPDAFLMAVAIGASSAFLTPIGHQNNALIMGLGGYRFGDYWRMGLPLEILIVAVAVPMIMVVWPM